MGSTASLDRSPRKNWVENSGNLPPYVREIARSIEREQAVPLSRAISLAIGAVKRWARGGGNVNGDTRAKAAKAVAQWTALRAKNAARQVATSHMAHADTVELADDGSVLTRRATGDGLLVLSQVTDSGTVVELARYVRTPAGAKRYGRPIGALIEPGAGRARGGKTSGGGNGSGRAASAGAGGRVTSSRGGGTSSGRAPSREERRAEAGRKLNRWAEQGREQALRREQKKIDRWKGQQDGALRSRQKQVARTWLTNQANGVPATDKRQRDLRAEQNAIGAELKRRGQAGSGGEITSTTSGDRLARMGTMEQRAALRSMSDAELKTAKAEMQGRMTAGKPNPTLDAINAERARRAGSTSPAAPSTPAAPAASSAASGDRSLADRMRNLDDAQLKAMDDALDKKGGAPTERHAAIKAERARRTGSGKPTPSPAPAATSQGGLADLGRPGVGPEQREQILRGLSDNDLARASAAMDAAVEQTKDQPDVQSVLVGRRGEVEREQMRRKTAATAGKRAETGGRTERAESAAARPAAPAPSTTPSRPKPDGPAKPAEQRPTAKATATAPSPARPATSPTLKPGERVNPAVVGPRRGGTPQGRPMETGTRRMGGADRAPEPAGVFPTAPQGVTRKVTDLPGLSEQQLTAERADAAQVLRWHVRNGTPRTSTDYADARSRQRALEAENGRRETADRSAGVTPAQRQRATADAGGTPSQVRVDALLGKHLTAKGLKGQAGDFAAYSPAEMRAAADQLDRTRSTAPYKKAAADLRRMADTYEASAADRAAGGSGNVSVLPTRSTTPGPARTAAPAGESRAERNARLLQQERAQDTGRAAERTADPKAMTPEQRTRVANRMRMESTAADTPAQASEMRRRADELEAMNTSGTVSPIRPADTPRPPWGDGPAMRTGDTGYEQAFRAASETQKAAESDLRYRQERVRNESFKPGDRLVVEGFRTPAAVVEITQDGERFTKTGNELKVRDVATGREMFVLRDNVKSREVDGETGMQTVTRLRAERIAALGGATGGEQRGQNRAPGLVSDADAARARQALSPDRAGDRMRIVRDAQASTPTAGDAVDTGALSRRKRADRVDALAGMSDEQRAAARQDNESALSKLNPNRAGDQAEVKRRRALRDDFLTASQRARTSRDKPELTPRAVLDEVIGGGNLDTREIAETFGVEQPQVLRVLRDLEKRGVIERGDAGTDGTRGGTGVSGGRSSVSSLVWSPAGGQDGADPAALRARLDAPSADQATPSTSPKQQRAKLARDRLAALEGTGALSLRAARVKGVDDDGLLAMLEVMNSRKGTQKLRGDVVGEMQRRGMSLPAARRGRGIREGGNADDDADDAAARRMMRGDREPSYQQDRANWQREAARLGENPTAEQLEKLTAGWDGGQIARLNIARRELGLPPVLTDRETVATRARAGGTRPIRDEVAAARSGPARTAVLQALSDADLDQIEAQETRENRERGNGRGGGGRAPDRRAQSAYAKRERIIRDVRAERDRRAGTTQPVDVQALYGRLVKSKDRDKAVGRLTDEQLQVLADNPQVQGGTADAVRAEIGRRAGSSPTPARSERDTPGTAANVQARQDAQGRANQRAQRGLFPEDRPIPNDPNSLFGDQARDDGRLTDAEITGLQQQLVRETDPKKKAALRRRIARGRGIGPVDTSHTSTQGVVDMAEPFGGKRAVPFGKKKTADAAGSGKPGATHADLTDQQLAAAIAKAKTTAKGASGKAAQSAAQTLVKLKAEQNSRGKNGGKKSGGKTPPPWVKTSNAGGAALDLSHEVPARAVPTERATKTAAALARMGL